MTTFLKASKRTFFFLFILLSIFKISVLKAQTNKKVPEIEGIYVHTDRTKYMFGESLWYKAYSVYPYSNLLFSKSNILYVELVSPDDEVVVQNKTILENGLGHGDFILNDSLGIKKPGMYQLRAYTNWNRNFDDHFVFKKNIEILNVLASPNSQPQEASKKSKKEDLKTNAIAENNVQFFPEGGSLISNVNNVVAFKATNGKGFPIHVKGEIYKASNDSLVTFFGTLHDGMGKFILKPKPGEKFYAKLLNSDKKTPIPSSLDQGYALGFRKIRGKNMLIIKTNASTLASQTSASFQIIFKFKGVTYFDISQVISSPTTYLEIPNNTLPEGINQVTLIDASNRPHSERLIYIEKAKDLEVAVTTNKYSYQPNENITVTVSSKNKTGEVALASYSISCVDRNGDESKQYNSNIATHFLMEFDIKGKVHNPGYYFDEANPRRLLNLDLLLLTQGWRNYLWKNLPETKPLKAPFLAEKGISFSGRVKQILGTKAKANNIVTLALFNNGKVEMLSTETDALGMFRFKDLMFYGKTKFVLSSKNEKGKGKGQLLLDKFNRFPLETNSNPQVVKIDTLQDATIKDNILRKYMSFGVMPENVLDEVEILAKKKTEPSQSIYGTPDRTFTFEDERRSFSTIHQLIQVTIPGVQVTGSTIKFTRYNGPAQIIVDGIPWEQEEVAFIQPGDVEKIETLNGASASILGANGGNGVILIYTKEGASNREKTIYHTVKDDIDGFYKARAFYVPNPSEKNEDSSKYAIRNTLYWNPYVHPENNGEIQLKYFNSSVETEVQITLEGLTATGIPVVKKTNYVIEQ
ncbi:hypothetical protein PW52_03360 [Tamlana sedimentorum]|uniref:TonB-dependent receptor plug domain-containing protein n=1 Tax=Neotamlana sedimentorum TaxID=1435349 RepID=A0A0D7WDB8_9FLAO|nr:TonB-dependent receptor plug domain-containing protein [Tamlana sedimentorum]KJD36693.1 hypothetical protein PW52_03360 [Tamlana sedimentorum]